MEGGSCLAEELEKDRVCLILGTSISQAGSLFGGLQSYLPVPGDYVGSLGMCFRSTPSLSTWSLGGIKSWSD